MDYPQGGSGAVAEALVRAIEKRGGEVRLRCRVDKLVEDGAAARRCSGVKLAAGGSLRARVGVLSNADVWRTADQLLPEQWRAGAGDAAGAGNKFFERPRLEGSALDAGAPLLPSFMHLHVGFNASGLDLEALGIHHITVADLSKPPDAEDNCVFISIPSALDASAAPPGYACLHAYLPATEPYAPWAGLRRGSDEYRARKRERSAPLWAACERVIPDLRARAVVEMAGTPLTHERFLRRTAGTYGPGYAAGERGYPPPATPIEGLWCVGEGSFPGIGVPAVAGNGAGVANTIAPLAAHLALLGRLREARVLVPDRDF